MSDAPPTGFYLHPASGRHDTGWGHPEHQGRLRALTGRIEAELPTLLGRVVQGVGGEADEGDLLRVHTADHLKRVQEAVARAKREGGVVALDADTVVSGASWDAALASAGAAIAACEAVAAGERSNAFVATRPPGHHATSDRAMGFCLVNHGAVAARWLQATGRAARILIVDWDVHHGNGTQEIFWEDGSVFYLSLHQWPHYPGTGSPSERGEGEGEGATLNVTLASGTPSQAYREAYRGALEEVRERFAPDFVLVSAGFDVLARDPLGGQELEPSDLGTMTEELLAWGRQASWEGRVVVLLEGGYVPERLGEGAVAVLRALSGA